MEKECRICPAVLRAANIRANLYFAVLGGLGILASLGWYVVVRPKAVNDLLWCCFWFFPLLLVVGLTGALYHHLKHKKSLCNQKDQPDR